jgi:hypothetical protein
VAVAVAGIAPGAAARQQVVAGLERVVTVATEVVVAASRGVSPAVKSVEAHGGMYVLSALLSRASILPRTRKKEEVMSTCSSLIRMMKVSRHNLHR